MTELRAFELYLMSLMRGESQIDSVLAALGISADAMRQEAARVAPAVGFLELVGHELDTYSRILGEPMETTLEPGIAADAVFGGSQRHRFHVPLWSDFDFILRTHPTGWVWGPEFVRRSGALVPALERARDLQPWTVLESEVVDRFGPFASEDAWNLGKDATYVIAEPGRRVEISLVFDLGVLQRVVAAESVL